MTTEPDPTPRRTPLTKAAVLGAAVDMADRSGAGVPSMRNLADRLGVKAMALYHHFRNKEALTDGMTDLVFAEIELPADGADWHPAMRDRARSLREALRRHPWASALMDSRAQPGPATLRHHDAVIGCLRGGGFTVAGAAHAFALIDAYVYGFALQERSLPFETVDDLEGVAEGIMQSMADAHLPHLAEMFTELALKPGYDYGEEFEVGLDLILDGLARRRTDWR
ncbi:TetR/AcrR family transcriptional regulator C-terminal domain-containing protein [Glycomyces paridis]|uniref:TetR family transcriptional regulator n=1 Tax=Glycomyces paridis TaxID=2126555 RepID=A0A4S8P2M3_9ACTN|nr:TetR/AcrR family transcriptional regulator C-terminal domain-containing protein [Glycomyces paridis]THV23551.1 TetR family transcriptional regulator [Glycomyces paridis]